MTDNSGEVADNSGEVTENNRGEADNIGKVTVSKSMAELTAAEDRKQPADDVKTGQEPGTVMETRSVMSQI